jgi:hypothetical protein
MSTMLKEVYDALKEAGVSEEKASAAAVAVSAYQLNRSNLATKEDIARLEREISTIKFDILKWVVGLALAQLALLVGILVKVV